LPISTKKLIDILKVNRAYVYLCCLRISRLVEKETKKLKNKIL